MRGPVRDSVSGLSHAQSDEITEGPFIPCVSLRKFPSILKGPLQVLQTL